MAVAFPQRHSCGHLLRRVYVPPAIHYAAAGFYTTDVSHFQKQLGPDRYAKFEHDRAAAIARSKTGTLTPYERQLDALENSRV